MTDVPVIQNPPTRRRERGGENRKGSSSIALHKKYQLQAQAIMTLIIPFFFSWNMAACSLVPECACACVRVPLMIAPISLEGTYICISGNGMNVYNEFNGSEDPREPIPPFCHFFHVSYSEKSKKKSHTAKWRKIRTRTNPTHIDGYRDRGMRKRIRTIR